MKKIEQTIDSREVAEMVDKEHRQLLKDIRRYAKQFNEGKISPVEFFKENTYKDSKGETRPCYRITKKGCEFIAHKLTGTKGTIFTARYINRFHEMQDILSKQETEPQLPWFIRKFRGKYIMLFRDFESLTGFELCGDNASKKYAGKLQGGYDYNVWNWHTVINKEEFLKEYGFEYGDESGMHYFYPSGIQKALELYRTEIGTRLNQNAYDMILDGLRAIDRPKKEIPVKNPQPIEASQPVQISIVVGNDRKAIVSI